MAEVKPKSCLDQQKYYQDKAVLEQAITESVMKFVSIYGGGLSAHIEVSSSDTSAEIGSVVNRKVSVDSVTITSSK